MVGYSTDPLHSATATLQQQQQPWGTAGRSATNSRLHSTRVIRRSPDQQQQQHKNFHQQGFQQPPRFAQQRRREQPDSRPVPSPGCIKDQGNRDNMSAASPGQTAFGQQGAFQATMVGQTNVSTTRPCWGETNGIMGNGSANGQSFNGPPDGGCLVAPPPGFTPPQLPLLNHSLYFPYQLAYPPMVVAPPNQYCEVRPGDRSAGDGLRTNENISNLFLGQQMGDYRLNSLEAAGQTLAQWKTDQERLAQQAASQEAAKQEAVRQEAARQEAARQEAVRQDASRQEAAKQEAANQEAARQEAVARRRRQAAAEQRYRVQADILSWLAANWAETAKQLAESSLVWPQKVVYYQPSF